MSALNELSPAELQAAMRQPEGVATWGTWGSALGPHVRYAMPIVGRAGRHKCSCGCGRRATHKGFANGVCLMSGCELRVARWVKFGPLPSPPAP